MRQDAVVEKAVWQAAFEVATLKKRNKLRRREKVVLLHGVPKPKPACVHCDQRAELGCAQYERGRLGPRTAQRCPRHGQRHPEEREKPIAHKQGNETMAEVCLGAHGLGALLAQKLASRGAQSLGHEREALHIDEGLSRFPVIHRLPCHKGALGQITLGDARHLATLSDAGSYNLPRCTLLVHDASLRQAYPRSRR